MLLKAAGGKLLLVQSNRWLDCTAAINCCWFFVVVVVCLLFFLLLSWMFEHDCLDTCCFGCLLCMCFVFLVFAPVHRN